MAGGYGCDGGALRWLSVVLQIERGREPERAERGIAVGDDSVASLEGSGRKQEVARGSRRWSLRARRLLTATAAALGRGEEDDREEEVGWAGQLRWAARWARMPGKLQVSFCSFIVFLFLFLYFATVFSNLTNPKQCQISSE